MKRREFLAASGASLSLAGFPIHGWTKDLPPGRMAVVMLEGGLDGLTAVPPIGDPNLIRRRRNLVASDPIKINPFFGLHPNLTNFRSLLARGEAAIAHATNFPYARRSHFEGQDFMQSGFLGGANDRSTGWLGRAMDLAGIAGRALAIDTPLVIRGAKNVDNFYPASLKGSRDPSSGLLDLLVNEHKSLNALTFAALKNFASETSGMARVRDPEGLALAAGKAMRDDDGPRVAVIRIPEFDTHANQGVDNGRHPNLIGILDRVIAQFKDGLGPVWKNSIVLTLTEFGRTVQENGSAGTDHGFGSVGLLAGGLIREAGILANWPGLAKNELYEGRDLYSTLDYRSICAACIEAALGLDHQVISERVFADNKLERTHDLLFG